MPVLRRIYRHREYQSASRIPPNVRCAFISVHRLRSPDSAHGGPLDKARFTHPRLAPHYRSRLLDVTVRKIVRLQSFSNPQSERNQLPFHGSTPGRGRLHNLQIHRLPWAPPTLQSRRPPSAALMLRSNFKLTIPDTDATAGLQPLPRQCMRPQTFQQTLCHLRQMRTHQ